MVQVAWTLEAERRLKDIFEYIATENPDMARQVAMGIYDRARTLREFPELGYRYQPSRRSVRILLYGRYRIAYLIRTDGHVDILGVFHTSMDLGRYEL